MLPPMAPVPSHRDFYPDQVLVDGDRLCVIDFDLFCDGDPGLDVGNFSAHITEHSLRMFGDAAALAPLERALEEAYVTCAGEAVRERVRVYASLTLARHVHLSTLFAERRAFTEPLLALCEQRLGLAVAA
jgi:aminoglycoside phosphotransferase (APT) family kinase protein